MPEIINGQPSDIDTFLELTDTLPDYTGHGGKVVKVKGTEDALEFGTAGVATFPELSDTPAAYTGQGGKVVKVKGTTDGLEFAAEAGGATVLNDLTDVNVVSPGQGDVARYNPSTSKFEKFHLMEAANRTINLDNSMTATEIQALIDSIGKYIPYPNIITLQFADGTYTLDQKLWFYGFYGGGGIRIWGNRTEANADALHTTQEVYLQRGTYNGIVIHLEACGIWIDIYNLLASIKSESDSDRVIQIDAVLNAELRFNYFTGTNPASGNCIHAFKNAAIGIKNTYFGNIKYAITSVNSRVFSDSNDDYGQQPAYGLNARSGGVIGKNGNQPAGFTANEITGSGGVIR